MLVTGERASGATASLGYSVFRPGTELGSVAHETEEFAYVASGQGALRLDGEDVRFRRRRRAPHPGRRLARRRERRRRGRRDGVRLPAPRLSADGASVNGDSPATQVAWACRILAAHGYEDLTLGHVSARDSEPDAMWIKRKGVSLAEVAPGDVLRTSINGDIQNASDMHLEAVLHTEVYRARAGRSLRGPWPPAARHGVRRRARRPRVHLPRRRAVQGGHRRARRGAGADRGQRARARSWRGRSASALRS